jgi:hypothetical protein
MMRQAVAYPTWNGSSDRNLLMLMSVGVWLTIGVGISTVLAVIRVFLAKRTARSVDLGSVSYQWIIENRAGSRDDGSL